MSLASPADGREIRPLRVGVLVTDPASAPGFRSGRRLRRVSERDLARGYGDPLLVVCAASSLPTVAGVAGGASRQHRLKGLLIRQDVGTGLIGPMLDRAGLRMWRNVLVHHGPPVPTRVLNAWEMGAENELIAEASVTGGVLFVLSCALERLDVPIRKIPALAGIRADDLRLLEVSPDGAYLHWPRGDIHLDLGSLRYVVDPVWRAKADAARVGHHEQFGDAVRAVREARGIPQNAIEGLSARHVRRIERGMFPKVATLRLLARAHGLELDQYLTAVAAEAERYESLREHRAPTGQTGSTGEDQSVRRTTSSPSPSGRRCPTSCTSAAPSAGA